MSRILNPTLTAIDGPLRGQTFALDENDIGIGRDLSNLIAVEDPAVSRWHCAIRRDRDGRFVVHDLDSRNGTFVNDLPIRERILQEGDEIRVGRCLFAFELFEEAAAPEDPLKLDEETLDACSSLQLRQDDTLYLNPQKLLGMPMASGRVARGLTTLMRISAAVQTARGAGELARRLLEQTLETVPAERGAVLLFDAGGDEPAWTYTWDRELGPGATVQAHEPVLRQVYREGIAILSNAPGNRSADVTSAPERPSRRVLAAPIRSGETTIGVIYVETADFRVYFDEDHLQLLTAIGGISGMAVENARRLEWLEAENHRLRDEINIEHDMVGESQAMREVCQFIAKVAPSDSTVLLCGESGTGKELVARAIHHNSRRAAAGPFVAINCATLSEPLLESELFGHEKGAFTGAVAQKKGKLEVAHGGTVFLDEIGELPPAIQAKLLRALQEREFERVGGTRPLNVDIRLIAATNRDLRAAVAKGDFRQDLFYRLNVVSLTLPRLRDRRGDIPLLARYFAGKYARRVNRHIAGLSPEAYACLVAYDWPGNIRELENAIERAVVLGCTDLILPEDLPETVLETPHAASVPLGSYQQTICLEKKRLILNALTHAGGVYTEAAKLLGVHPNYLHRLARNLNLKGEIQKPGAAHQTSG